MNVQVVLHFFQCPAPVPIHGRYNAGILLPFTRISNTIKPINGLDERDELPAGGEE